MQLALKVYEKQVKYLNNMSFMLLSLLILLLQSNVKCISVIQIYENKYNENR